MSTDADESWPRSTNQIVCVVRSNEIFQGKSLLETGLPSASRSTRESRSKTVVKTGEPVALEELFSWTKNGDESNVVVFPARSVARSVTVWSPGARSSGMDTVKVAE